MEKTELEKATLDYWDLNQGANGAFHITAEDAIEECNRLQQSLGPHRRLYHKLAKFMNCVVSDRWPLHENPASVRPLHEATSST